jgi:hypothetical protein
VVGPSGSTWPFSPRNQAGSFFFDFDPIRNEVIWSSGNSPEVLGLAEAGAILHGAFFLAYVHPADRYRVESLLESVLQGSGPYVATYRWIRPDTQEVRVLHCRGMLEADGSLMRGFIIDLSAEVPTLQSHCDFLDSMGFGLSQLGVTSLTIDTEFRIRSSHGPLLEGAFSLGLQDLDLPLLRPGRSFPECFKSDRSRDVITELLSRALNGSVTEMTWRGYEGHIRPVVVTGVVQGLVVVVADIKIQQSLEDAVKSSETRLRAFEESAHSARALIDLTQEMVGFAALVGRQANGNPLVRHAMEALLTTAREAGVVAQKLIHDHESLQLGGTAKPTTRNSVPEYGTETTISGIKGSGATIVFAAKDRRTSSSFTSLLMDSGFHCASASLEEGELRNVLLTHKFVRLVILDISHETHHGALLLRRIRKFFPALQLLCLVSGPVDGFPELRSAGANQLLAKPVSARDIERVARNLLSLTTTRQKES